MCELFQGLSNSAVYFIPPFRCFHLILFLPSWEMVSFCEQLLQPGRTRGVASRMGDRAFEIRRKVFYFVGSNEGWFWCLARMANVTWIRRTGESNNNIFVHRSGRAMRRFWIDDDWRRALKVRSSRHRLLLYQHYTHRLRRSRGLNFMQGGLQ